MFSVNWDLVEYFYTYVTILESQNMHLLTVVSKEESRLQTLSMGPLTE